MLSLPNNHHHSKNESNYIDPDDANSWLCTACNLPIFATPFTGGGTTALLHDHCTDLPQILKNCELHPQKPLLLADNNSSATCSECSEKCGSKLYFCPDSDSDCGLVLDVACALPIKILHRSHRHRLMAVHGSAFHICFICGEYHRTEAAAKSRSYLCTVCGFSIHSDCATSAHVIVHDRHVHPLVLYYDILDAFGGPTTPPEGYFFDQNIFCAICERKVVGGAVYVCNDCDVEYALHISCATSDRSSFRPVLGREAKFATIVHLPIPDEHQSIVRYVKDTRRVNFASSELIFQHHSNTPKSDEDEDEDENDKDRRVCDGCLKTITSTDPFYSCSVVYPKLFLHDYCYRNLPLALSESPIHTHLHSFIIDILDHIKNDLGFYDHFCGHCKCQILRVGYTSDECNFIKLDTSCALMPFVITHAEHITAHFLRLSHRFSRDCCDCCGRSLSKIDQSVDKIILSVNIAYECRTCPNFALHTWCAMLPKNVTHKFDPHPLHLITTTNANANKESNNDIIYDDICEICERGIDNKVWYYGCEICNQSFHVDCIPCLDLMYKIKSLCSVGRIRMTVPTRLIRGLTLQGHGHDYCTDVADEYDHILPSDEH